MHKLTDDRMKWGIAALLAATTLSLACLALPYAWLRLPGATVSVDGKAAARARVYESYDGRLFACMDGPGEWPGYIIDRVEGEVFMPCYQSILDDVPETSHFLATAGFALIMNDHYRPGVVRHFEDALPGGYAEMEPGRVEFADPYFQPGSTPGRPCRVRIRW